MTYEIKDMIRDIQTLFPRGGTFAANPPAPDCVAMQIVVPPVPIHEHELADKWLKMFSERDGVVCVMGSSFHTPAIRKALHVFAEWMGQQEDFTK